MIYGNIEAKTFDTPHLHPSHPTYPFTHYLLCCSVNSVNTSSSKTNNDDYNNNNIEIERDENNKYKKSSLRS